MHAPLIPGLTDHEIPQLLAAAAAAGAQAVGYTIVRLPLAVRPIFLDWLERTQPLKAQKVAAMLKEVRGGELNDPQFGARMTGEGSYARTLNQTFRVFRKKYGLDGGMPALDVSRFRREGAGPRQLELFS
jgi:DNA repair photolyase